MLVVYLKMTIQPFGTIGTYLDLFWSLWKLWSLCRILLVKVKNEHPSEIMCFLWKTKFYKKIIKSSSYRIPLAGMFLIRQTPPKKPETTSLSIKVPHNCKNNMRPVGTYGNYIKKCPDVIENVAQILIRMVLLNRG